MTAHTHTEFFPGCYRCELGRDEVSGDEHPSGLRDAKTHPIYEPIAEALKATLGGTALQMSDDQDQHLVAFIATREVLAWLSVVSEDEIEAAARAIWLSDLSDHHGVTHEAADCFARAALAASRGVRLPKETT